MQYSKAYLKPQREESVKRYHPWIFSGAIDHIDGTPQEGEIVEVYDAGGNYLAKGHCQLGSIAVRILTFDKVDIDHDFWKNRIESAYRFRKALDLTDRADNNIYRLIHGEGDGLSGLIVDIYSDTAVIQVHSIGMHLAKEEIAHTLKEVMGDKIHNVYYKSESALSERYGYESDMGYLIGGDKIPELATENGLKFYIDWIKGQKTGFFIDQRENRLLLEKYAKGRRILNMFCYTGSFSCYAMRGGAELVHSVDSSSKAIDLTNKNLSVNFPGDGRHTAFAEDAFHFMQNIDDRYDLIILDPPAFAKHRSVLKNALQGYRKLNTIALEKIKTGGILFTFSCSQAVGKDNFRQAILSAAVQAKRKVRIMHQLTQAPDHPINIYHPESEYLKGLVLYVE